MDLNRMVRGPASWGGAVRTTDRRFWKESFFDSSCALRRRWEAPGRVEGTRYESRLTGTVTFDENHPRSRRHGREGSAGARRARGTALLPKKTFVARRMAANRLIPELGVSSLDRSLVVSIHVIGCNEGYRRPEERLAFLEVDGSRVDARRGREAWTTFRNRTLESPHGQTSTSNVRFPTSRVCTAGFEEPDVRSSLYPKTGSIEETIVGSGITNASYPIRRLPPEVLYGFRRT